MSQERLDRLRERLKPLNLADVAEVCETISPDAPGISRNNIRAIRDGKTTNPGIITLEVIETAVAIMENTGGGEVGGAPAPQVVAS